MTGRSGLFVTIDGPGGSGKSTVAALITRQLAEQGLPVHATTEPSPTPLGRLIRAGTDEYTGMALACLVAGDRHHHLAAGIRPRLAARGRHSRFERQPGSSQTESGLYHDTATRLAAVGWPVCSIDVTTRSAAEAAIIVTGHILALHADPNRSSHDPCRPVPADVQHR